MRSFSQFGIIAFSACSLMVLSTSQAYAQNKSNGIGRPKSIGSSTSGIGKSINTSAVTSNFANLAIAKKGSPGTAITNGVGSSLLNNGVGLSQVGKGVGSSLITKGTTAATTPKTGLLNQGIAKTALAKNGQSTLTNIAKGTSTSLLTKGSSLLTTTSSAKSSTASNILCNPRDQAFCGRFGGFCGGFFGSWCSSYCNPCHNGWCSPCYNPCFNGWCSPCYPPCYSWCGWSCGYPCYDYGCCYPWWYSYCSTPCYGWTPVVGVPAILAQPAIISTPVVAQTPIVAGGGAGGVTPIAPGGPTEPAPETLQAQTKRFLAIKNDSGEKVQVFVQYAVRGADGSTKWLPGEPGSDKALSLNLNVGQELFVEDNGQRIATEVVRLWAVCEKGQFLEFKGKDLRLVTEQDQSGAYVYQANEIKTFTFVLPSAAGAPAGSTQVGKSQP